MQDAQFTWVLRLDMETWCMEVDATSSRACLISMSTTVITTTTKTTHNYNNNHYYYYNFNYINKGIKKFTSNCRVTPWRSARNKDQQLQQQQQRQQHDDDDARLPTLTLFLLRCGTSRALTHLHSQRVCLCVSVKVRTEISPRLGHFITVITVSYLKLQYRGNCFEVT